MKTLFKLYAELLPVLAFIPAGYIIKKKFAVNAEYISFPLIKILMPILVFFNMLDAESEKLYVLPSFTLLLALAMVPVANLTQKRLAQDFNPMLLKSSFSFFNIAFFGIPTVTALFGEDKVSTLICIYLGSAIYGDTVGYFQVAKTKYNTSKALKEVAKIPFLYIFVAGIVCKFLDVQTPQFMEGPLSIISLTVTCAGMLIVGFQLADVSLTQIRISYYLKLIGVRTIAAVVILGTLMALEYFIFHRLDKEDYQMLFLVSLFPVATNVTVFASFLESEEEKASLIVVISALVSLLLVSVAALFLS